MDRSIRTIPSAPFRGTMKALCTRVQILAAVLLAVASTGWAQKTVQTNTQVNVPYTLTQPQYQNFPDPKQVGNQAEWYSLGQTLSCSINNNGFLSPTCLGAGSLPW